MACCSGHVEVVRLLIERGASADHSDKVAGIVLMLKYLQLLYNVYFSFEDGVSALQTAATNGHREVVGLLLQKGANCGSNPLLSAACEGHVEVVRILLEKGANVHAQLKVIRADAISSYVMVSFVDLHSGPFYSSPLGL